MSDGCVERYTEKLGGEDIRLFANRTLLSESDGDLSTRSERHRFRLLAHNQFLTADHYKIYKEKLK